MKLSGTSSTVYARLLGQGAGPQDVPACSFMALPWCLKFRYVCDVLKSILPLASVVYLV